MTERLRPEWIDTPDGVKLVADTCADTGRFAVDTEADSLHSYFHKVCLIQVSANGRHFVIDPLALDQGSLDPLWHVVGDPRTPVVMHGADYDIRVLDRDFSARVGGLVDTQIMAQLLGAEKTGLGALLTAEFGIELDKRYQRANWGRRPLLPEMLAYAAADTAHLIPLAEKLRSRLEDLGRWQWAEEEFGKLEGVRFEPVNPDPLAFERVKGARALADDARDRLASLYQWRERQARRRNLPPFKVLGNRPMIELAENPPESLDAMAKVPGIGSRFVRRSGRDVMKTLKKPRMAPPKQPANRDPSLPAAARRRAKRLTEVRDKLAAKEGLPSGLLCPKATVQALALNASDIESFPRAGLTGWRLDLLGERFVRALTEK